jgi:hypothetical protein
MKPMLDYSNLYLNLQKISTVRKNKSLSKFCGSIKNLGVSGGSLEDYLAISNIVLNNKVAIPKKFFIK